MVRISLLLSAILLTTALTPCSLAFDSQPHVLVLPGHTNSLSAGPDGEVLVTCDYKTLDGRVPRPGEPCTGEPTLAISVKDLKNLRYISEGRDNNEIVQRVYERYDNIVFIVSPDFEVNLGGSGYDREVSPITVKHPLVPTEIADAYSSLTERLLRHDEPSDQVGDHALGKTIPPFGYDAAFENLGGINPIENRWRPLPNYHLIFLPKNPPRTTVIHELLHFLMDIPRQGAIFRSQRREELLRNNGMRRYLAHKVLVENSSIPMEEQVRAAYELSHLLYSVEHIDDSAPEEIEINYFISKYYMDLGLSSAAKDHFTGFWIYADMYRNIIRGLSAGAQGGYLIPTYAQRYVREKLPFNFGGVTRPNYYYNIWGNVQTLAQAYPKTLLGDESNPEPGTMMYQFIRDIGTRAQTGK